MKYLLAFSLLNPQLLMNFLELNQGTQSWIDWPFPVTIPFILFACLLGWEFLLLLSKSAKLAVIFGPTAFFFLSLTLTLIPWSSLIIIHGSSAGESSSRYVLQWGRDPLCLFLSCLSWGCHSLFVHLLATSPLGFHFRKNLLRSSSLCAQLACSNRT